MIDSLVETVDSVVLAAEAVDSVVLTTQTVETPPVIWIRDADPESGAEGDPDAAHREFEIYLSHASKETITVEYATDDGTAVGNSDFEPIAPTTLTFEPGETSKTISVAILDDDIYEQEENFIVELTNPTNATIELGYDYGIAEIVDDDLPVVWISDADPESGEEGDPDAAVREFEIYLSQASTETITVEYATIDIKAVGDSDFEPIAPTTLTFAPGETSKTVSVAILDDNVHESDENFIVELSNATNATIELGYDYGIAEIIDDDLPGISIDCPDKEAAEIKTGKSNSGKFSFKRTGDTTDALNVKYTIEGSATNGTDYTKVADTIAFAAGSDTSTIEIKPIYDGISEGTESVTLKLSDSDNYTIVGDKSETANITDLVIPVKNIDEFKNPVGTSFQGKPEGELIDLRGFAGRNLKVDTVSTSDAAYQNYIGFYAVEDAQGTLANGLKVGDAGYAKAAIQSAIMRGFKTETQSDLAVTGGKIFAPVVIANGTFEDFLNRNPQNQANSNIHAYFNYTGANTDGVDHFRFMGDNKFGVEDLYGGGDKDYNDIVVQLTVKG